MAVMTVTKENFQEEVMQAGCRCCWIFGPPGAAVPYGVAHCG